MSEERTKSGLRFKPVSNLAPFRTTLGIPDTACEVSDLLRRRLYLTGGCRIRHESTRAVKTFVK